MHPFEVLLRPIVSEKSQIQSGESRAIFEVARDANKAMIKQAVELAFPQVKVIAVNTMVMRGKSKRMGMRVTKRPDWKKAVVTLRPGDHIEFFEGV
jgi:large subunit ribosomal protein L23